MFLDINTIGREKVSFERDLGIPNLEGPAGEAIRVVSARLVGEAAREGRGVELLAAFQARLELTCGRCLETFAFEVDEKIRRLLIAEPVQGNDEIPRVPEDDDDEETLRVAGGKASLEDIATEQIYLSLPLKPVCSAGCKGLCPACGVNRNLETCGCLTEDVDERLAPLLEFKRRRERN
jgi:uncharacterized protein